MKIESQIIMKLLRTKQNKRAKQIIVCTKNKIPNKIHKQTKQTHHLSYVIKIVISIIIRI